MKKIICGIVMMLVVTLFVATQATAVTFPTADKHTLVSSHDVDGKGVIKVKACGEKDWVLVQYCQDNMRAGAPYNVIVKPFKVDGDMMWFQLDMDGVKDGQVAFNFRNTSLSGNPWLNIPDCHVKTDGTVVIGDSRPAQDIPESGGAMFVYIGSGIQVQYPIDSSQWCDEGVMKVVAPVKGAECAPVPAKAGEGITQTKSPDAVAVHDKQVGGVVAVKGNNNKTVTNTKQYKAVVTNKGATVKFKGNNNNVRACTYNINLINVGDGGPAVSKNCGECHDETFWKGFQDCTTPTKTTTKQVEVIRKNK